MTATRPATLNSPSINECGKDEDVEVELGKTRKDMVRNGEFRRKLKVAKVEGKVILQVAMVWTSNEKTE